MRNAIFIVNIKGNYFQDFSKFCLYTWRFWAEKNNAVLFVLEKPSLKAENFAPHLQKYLAFEILKENGVDADRVAIVDADTMIKWDCPDFFDISNDGFSAILDDEHPKWVNRSLAAYQFLFPGTKVNWWEYFNSGIMVFEKKYRPLLSDFLDFVLSKEGEVSQVHELHKAKVGFDQTLFNFFVKQRGISINFLPKIFNLYHLSQKKVLEKKGFIDYAYIWHFNGMEHSEREKYMRETWDKIKKHYQ